MRYKNFIFNLTCTLAAFVSLISMYVYPDMVRSSAKEALGICAYSLVPALFPYITCTRILCEFSARFLKKENSHTIKLFGFTKSSFLAHLLGLISGFPSGAVIATDFYKSGAIDKAEAEKLIAFSNCISPAFCIIIVGNEIIGSYVCGVILFISVLISNFLCMLILGNNKNQKNSHTPPSVFTAAKNGIPAIIKDCSVVMLNICAFVTFFICIGNLIIYILGSHFTLNDEIKVIISSVMEISAGAVKLSSLDFGKKILLGSMVISFGGISSIMQVMSICEKYFLSAKRFIMSKILSALFSPVITFLIFKILPEGIFSSINVGKSLYILLKALPLVFTFLPLFITLMLHYRRKMIKKKC